LSDITTDEIGRRSALSENSGGFGAGGSKQKSDSWKIHLELYYQKRMWCGEWVTEE
jgi:hypothetical protein